MHAYTGSFRTAQGPTLFTRTYLPDGTARAAVIVAHGYAEHSGRYEALAHRLVAEGYAVYALDYRGHGQSGGKRASIRVFREYVDDLVRFIDRVRETRPHPPRFLFGHSMGGLIALQLVLEHPEKVEGLGGVGRTFTKRGAGAASFRSCGGCRQRRDARPAGARAARRRCVPGPAW